MQKFTLSICSICALFILGLSSCKDDDEPFVKPKLSVATETVTIGEGGGTAEVEIVLDKAAPTAITVEYSLGGTAVSPADYSVVGTEGEIDIPQGQTSATIKITIVDDAIFEGNETIEIELQDVNSDDIEITNDDEAVITITDNDTQTVASFTTTTLTVKESDNESLLEIEVSLSVAAPQAVTIKYEFTHGEDYAIDDLYGAAQNPPIPARLFDFEIDGGQQQISIAQGSTTGVIKLQLFSDFMLEDDEKIEITLTEATGATIGTNNKINITLNQEDGKAIVLVWDDDYTDVDMDMFLWIGETITTFEPNPITSSLNAGSEPNFELVFIPSIVETAAFGLSYVYYSGSADPMNFESHFIDFTDGEFAEDFDAYPGTYTAANLNEWDKEGAPVPAVVQTFVIDAGTYKDITDIEEPATGSRKPTMSEPLGLKKTKSIQAKIPRWIRSF